MRTQRLLFNLLLVFSVSSSLYAQKVQWAGKLLGFSSEYRKEEIGQEYRATQVLGTPNTLPPFGESACAWSPYNADVNIEEWIKVGFVNPQTAKQLYIVENFNAGAVIQVYAYDAQGKETFIYQNQATQPPKAKGRVLEIPVPDSTLIISALKIILNPSRVRGYNQIDAIGLTKNTESLALKVNVSADAPTKLIKKNVGKGVNSKAEEIAPVISPDARTLYFTRLKHEKNTGTPNKQDVWLARATARGGWGAAENIGAPINNAENNGVVAISADGRSIFLMNVYRPDGTMTAGLSQSKISRGEWVMPVECKIDNFYNLDKYNNLEFATSPMRNVLVMSVKRKDTNGGRDLYVSKLKTDGTWSEPVNMGNVINTASTEGAPFVASDNKTIYFTSLGHPGYGDSDIFVSRRLDDTWTAWSPPENLGSGVNTPKWDGYLTVPANGELGYMCSIKGKSVDIFQFKVFEEISPEPVAIVSGTVLDADTRKPITADIAVQIAKNNSVFSKLNYDPETGEFKTIVPTRETYRLATTKEKYFSKEDIIDLSKDRKYNDIKLTILLVPIKEGQKITMSSTMFEQGDFKVQASAFADLDKLATVMTQNSAMEILLEGHTDNQGEPALNLKLSEDRVREVKNYLVGKGIAAERVQTKAWGSLKPIASNELEETRRRNRRVEFTIIKL
jgi:outer membrane protein OmpA-like peptidoglycan-associated protein